MKARAFKTWVPKLELGNQTTPAFGLFSLRGARRLVPKLELGNQPNIAVARMAG